jgi:hypothetical protein
MLIDSRRTPPPAHDQGGRMEKRSQLAEHPFGTLKHRAGMHHSLMRGLEKCRGELSLMVLCYNFTRVLNLLGLEAPRDYCAGGREIRPEWPNTPKNKAQDGLY